MSQTQELKLKLILMQRTVKNYNKLTHNYGLVTVIHIVSYEFIYYIFEKSIFLAKFLFVILR